jgi:hypothetical protein
MSFDAGQTFETVLPTPDGDKRITVRYPTDEEWAQRQRTRKTVIKHLGRGQSKTTTTGGEDADLACYERIRQEGSDTLDAFEVAVVLDRLSRANVVDVEKQGKEYEVTLQVLDGTVTHVLKMPSRKQIQNHRDRFASFIDLPFNTQRMFLDLASAGSTYDALFVRNEGYAGSVPLPHKVAAVQAVITTLESEFEEGAEGF